MTDLHTHILPGMDDGAQTVQDALAMLHEEAQQGVDTVALTPHFSIKDETIAEFLARREKAHRRLMKELDGKIYPKLVMGAEVAWAQGMPDWPELEALCYEGTKILLVELPVTPWTHEMFRQLYSLEGRRGILPMIAHVERYLHCQEKRSIERLLDMGYPVQVSVEALLHMFSRRKALELLVNYDALPISDCHDISRRKPNMGAALKMIEKKLGRHMAWDIASLTDDALMD